ncbi:MAG: hypothetical protein LBK60_01075 [Verrucomicrobiales bacterium]|jgi:hypothetical protein|nr:hypothetical protein [Verrucomicrobiales bacterium]
MKSKTPKEGLQILRLIMVLSSMAPLFMLWAIRGSGPVPDKYFIPACLSLAFVPTAILWFRIHTAKRKNDCLWKVICHADDHRDHILVYLFAMLLPFYTVTLNDQREFATTIVALIFILFLFWHLNMHYMNIVFAMMGYRVFTITPDTTNALNDKNRFVILTQRTVLSTGDKIEVYRLSDTVFIEK